MAINRRNILIGLGALVGGGGALVGTGAFTTVSAAREVSVDTAGDANAYLTIEGDDNYVSNDNSDTLTINLGGADDSTDRGFNQNAVTTLSDVVTITNNSADGTGATVGVSTDAPSNSPTASGNASFVFGDGSYNEVAVVTFYVGDASTDAIGSGSTVDLSSGSSAALDVEIDTTDSTLNNAGSIDADPSLTIVATEQSS
ncbi:hypothetical protein [Haloferax sp. ATB1]|uniref:hypothetical protein n=1 Tax=Haloferax sp. ATB1 TaxID=1508454 RepID=UPI0005B1FD45|nr:hypothetical protein [Haloferax sp. ATB1]